MKDKEDDNLYSQSNKKHKGVSKKVRPRMTKDRKAKGEGEIEARPEEAEIREECYKVGG
jgi:hypothetical protein